MQIYCHLLYSLKLCCNSSTLRTISQKIRTIQTFVILNLKKNNFDCKILKNRLTFYHNNTDDHAKTGCAVDDPVVLFGVFHLFHQQRCLNNTEKLQINDNNDSYLLHQRSHLEPTLTSVPKIGGYGKTKLK